MSITVKDNKSARHIQHRFHVMKQRVHYAGHAHVWIINQSRVIDTMAKVLPKKDLLKRLSIL
jgi:hypothetical protein